MIAKPSHESTKRVKTFNFGSTPILAINYRTDKPSFQINDIARALKIDKKTSEALVEAYKVAKVVYRRIDRREEPVSVITLATLEELAKSTDTAIGRALIKWVSTAVVVPKSVKAKPVVKTNITRPPSPKPTTPPVPVEPTERHVKRRWVEVDPDAARVDIIDAVHRVRMADATITLLSKRKELTTLFWADDIVSCVSLNDTLKVFKALKTENYWKLSNTDAPMAGCVRGDILIHLDVVKAILKYAEHKDGGNYIKVEKVREFLKAKGFSIRVPKSGAGFACYVSQVYKGDVSLRSCLNKAGERVFWAEDIARIFGYSDYIATRKMYNEPFVAHNNQAMVTGHMLDTLAVPPEKAIEFANFITWFSTHKQKYYASTKSSPKSLPVKDVPVQLELPLSGVVTASSTDALTKEQEAEAVAGKLAKDMSFKACLNYLLQFEHKSIVTALLTRLVIICDELGTLVNTVK